MIIKACDLKEQNVAHALAVLSFPRPRMVPAVLDDASPRSSFSTAKNTDGHHVRELARDLPQQEGGVVTRRPEDEGASRTWERHYEHSTYMVNRTWNSLDADMHI